MSDTNQLKIGDLVKLTGPDWGEHQGSVVRVDWVDQDGQAGSNIDGVGSVNTVGGRWYTGGYDAELFSEAPTSPLIQPTVDQITAFQRAWEAADNLGLTGERTRAGLIAVLNLKETP